MQELNKKLRLFVSVYRSQAPEDSGFICPVSAGAALYGKEHPMLKQRDDEGENISRLNPQYCELTVQYQAWKNRDFDVGGLMHQRRYFDCSDVQRILAGRMPKRRPYRIFRQPDEPTLCRIGMDSRNIIALTERFPVITTIREDIGCSVADYYRKHDQKGFDDLGLLSEIIREKYPGYVPDGEAYFNGRMSYFCNLFIMDREHFDRYSEWLFDILFEYDRRKPRSLWQSREQGKLAERLFGVYLTHLRRQGDVPVCELPRAHFARIDGVTAHNFSFSRVFYCLAPPGSRRRALLRRL